MNIVLRILATVVWYQVDQSLDTLHDKLRTDMERRLASYRR